MKYKLPILAVSFCLIASLAALGENQPTAGENSNRNEPEQDLSEKKSLDSKGQSLIRSAARAAYDYTSISAMIRQRVNLFGHELAGSGRYLQIGTNNDKLFRLELKIPVGEKISSHLQVCDGNFLWIRTDLLNEITINRIDLRQVRKYLESKSHQPLFDSTTGWLTLGGLPNLLTSLDYFFQFSSPIESQLSDLSTWEIHGIWKPKELANILPDQKELILTGKIPLTGSLPEQIPESVIITLGKDDLFPYQIKFMRPTGVRNSNSDDSRNVPFLTLELFEVRTEIDPLDVNSQGRDFVYNPQRNETEIKDITEQYLKKISDRTDAMSE